jgi:thiamine biosynthesis lipoprotein
MPLVEALPVRAGTAQWPVWSTTARVVTADPSAITSARELVERQLDAVDRAASRFRADSEVRRCEAARGRPVPVSPLLTELVQVALDAAAGTGGDVDPTLGTQLSALGYDRDLSLLADSPYASRPPLVRLRRRAVWRDVRLDRTPDGGGLLTLPDGVLLDLGATAKAWTADRCATSVAREVGSGVLVSLGGDLRVAGPEPAEGWTVLVQDGSDEPASTIRLEGARAVATSSTLSRTWRRAGHRMHHVIDPVTTLPVEPVWRTVSVAAASCLRANVLSTSALVRGRSAPSMLRDRGVPARLVAQDGTVLTMNGWPAP